MEVLTLFGLGSDADAVYRTMLRNPQAGIPQVADQLGWHVDQVRQALDELSRLSLVRPSWEVPGRYQAVAPQVGLAVLLSRQEAELRERQERVAASKVALERAIEEYAEIQRHQQYAGVEQLLGIDAIRGRIEALAHEARSEIMGFAPEGAQTPENMTASKPLDAEIMRRGVLLRTIYLDSITKDSSSMSYAQWLVEQGGEIRSIPVLPLRMIIYDRKVVMLPMDPENSTAGAVLLRGVGVVTALCELFERVWTSATPLGAAAGSTDDGLTPQEQAVLRLLAQGNTDEAVARKLGVSVRTGRRIVAGLAARLGAQSRFQAGVEAARRGWLDAAQQAPRADNVARASSHQANSPRDPVTTC
ncbi:MULTISPECIES: helix-turn-helix transcriptional regulator [Streptomyces]|uniref:Helix-turn-helix domain-containing protein n=1 Tax=Streptomyces eurythermus TaxID=42237 RepID=A0ABW6Z992_9ACTN|nr:MULTISPECIES: LuxR family transcriptional regulator [Streptomyces]